ncbi:centrosomal protein of 95 kDa isoform X2 [Perognathus longimembris pacificus]|uniref:centrosomal protein of 95 kDa isoform X2 n=1 Tax=Perognathus longimembris pacificus TaxID=214514 RepID=UPI002019BD14|nr:centrosomal protein of 95 kDa isoform X2 [Perognathus longimembris pacificus]
MAGSEAEWVNIANNLLFKCHIHLRIHELEDCDANVFIALYQSILGEKVPDLIVIPRSQEDDAHNVQAVIDSLALDYLQVSLSHITGENIVKGDKESIKNLLEIFDGLLEYLTEHISETSFEKSEAEQYFKEPHQGEPMEGPESSMESKLSWKRVDLGRHSHPSDALGPSWNEDEAESTGEIIRLGETAHTYSLRSNGAHISTDTLSRKSLASPTSRKSLASPSSRSHDGVLTPPSFSFPPQNRAAFDADKASPVSTIPSARKLGEPIRAAIPLHPPFHPLEPRAPCPIGREYLRSSYYSSPVTNSTGERTTFLVEPKDEVLSASKLHKAGEQEPCAAQAQSPRTRKFAKGKRNENRAAASSWDLPRKRLTEQEIHTVSQKVSQRLCELDWMLRNALGDRIKSKPESEDDDIGKEEARSASEEEVLSQHSDSIMEYGPKKPRPGIFVHKKPPYRSHSLSPSPTNKSKQFQTGRRKQRKAKGADIRQIQAKTLTDAFERVLRKNKVQQNIGPQGISEEEEETKKIYGEAVHKGTPKHSQPRKIYARKTTAQSPRGGFPKSNKATPMKVKEHSLLPLMLEQFPFLYVSDPTLNKMWKQQIAHSEQLRKEAYGEDGSKKKLHDEIEEALRRHDLLTALVKKEYEHNRRLQDFRDRIHRQRLTQSKIKENRQQIVRARKYYDDYRVQLRGKMLRMRTREEMLFKKLFEEGLQIQKQRLRDLRNYAKEKRDEEKRQHQNELDSLENYYKDQFSLLAEAISQERQALKAREKSQAQTLHKVKRELRLKMEKEIQQLQCMIAQNDEDAFFRELEAERFKARLQLASFQYSKNPFP